MKIQTSSTVRARAARCRGETCEPVKLQISHRDGHQLQAKPRVVRSDRNPPQARIRRQPAHAALVDKAVAEAVVDEWAKLLAVRRPSSQPSNRPSQRPRVKASPQPSHQSYRPQRLVLN